MRDFSKNMKKVIYIDTASFNGHKQFNSNNLRILGEMCALDVFFKKDYLDYHSLRIQNVFESSFSCFPNNIKYKSRIGHFLKTFFGQLKILKESLAIVKKNKYDLVIFSWVDIIPFWLKTKHLKGRVCFYEHGLYYTQKHKYIRFFWRHLRKNICPIILEDYFSQYIKTILKCKNNQYLVRHPLGKIEQTHFTSEELCSVVIFAPSQSNEQHFIQELLNSRNHIPNGFFVVAKGQLNFESDKLLIYKDVLPRKQYDLYISKSTYILIPYPSDYNYRTSGVIFEGVASGKKILLLEGNTLQYMSKKYPYIFTCFSNVGDFIECLYRIKNSTIKRDDLCKKDFASFLSEYSDESLSNSFGDLLNDIPYAS